MHHQSWMATLVFVLIGFGGGYVAGTMGPRHSAGGAPASAVAARAYFSPHGGCTDAVVNELNAARQTIQLQGYTFTSHPISTALVAAASRGVHVTVILDAAQAGDQRAEAQYLVGNGVPVLVDSRHAMAHSNVVLVDTRTLITGSFTFSPAAEEDNAENLLIIHDQPRLQSAYEDNFRTHLDHAERFDAK